MDIYNYLQEHAIIKTNREENTVTVMLEVEERHRPLKKIDEREESKKVKVTTPMIQAYLQMCKNIKIDSIIQVATVNNEHVSSLNGTWVFKTCIEERKRKKTKTKKRG